MWIQVSPALGWSPGDLWSMKSITCCSLWVKRQGLCALESSRHLMWAFLLGISGLPLAKENSLKKDNYGLSVAKTHSNWEVGALLNKGGHVKAVPLLETKQIWFKARWFRISLCRLPLDTQQHCVPSISTRVGARWQAQERNCPIICSLIFYLIAQNAGDIFEIALSFWW